MRESACSLGMLLMSFKVILKPCNSIFDITPDLKAVPYLFLQIQLSKKNSDKYCLLFILILQSIKKC